MKKSRLFLVVIIVYLCAACSSDKVALPKEETLYLFPFKSEVDAMNLGCGHQAYESWGDWFKEKVRKKVGDLDTSELLKIGKELDEHGIPYTFVEEHPKKAWVEGIVDDMRPFLVENEFPYHTYIIAADFFNAFTAPGGNIYVTTGLLDEMENEHELAYIMGHELGHNENDHTKELAKLHRYIEMEGVGVFNRIMVALGSSICNKSDELECDIASMYLLEKAGYDPELALGGVAALRRISQVPESAFERTIIGFFNSHPWSDDRDKCVTQYVKQYKTKIGCDTVYRILGKVITKRSPLGLYTYPSKQKRFREQEIPKDADVQVICKCVPQERGNINWLYVQYEDDVGAYLGWVNRRYVSFDDGREKGRQALN